MKIETLIVKELVYYTKNLDIISCARCCHGSRASRQIRCEDASKICDWRRNISFFRHWALRRVPTNVGQASTVRQFERSLVMILAMGKSGKTIRNVTYILDAVTSSGILKAKQKLGVTFNSDKLGDIDFTKISKLTMCSAGAGRCWLVQWPGLPPRHCTWSVLKFL